MGDLADQAITPEWLRSIGGHEEFRDDEGGCWHFFQFVIKEEAIKDHQNVLGGPKESGLDVLYLNVHPAFQNCMPADVELYYDNHRDETECVPLFGKEYLDGKDIMDLLLALGWEPKT